MLKFYGIRFNQQGAPERFTLSFALGDSLHAGLAICERLDADPKETVKAIELEIERLFQGPDSKLNNKRFRLLIAKWFRTRDMVQFLLAHKDSVPLKLEIARILDSRETIENKWQQIEPLILAYSKKLAEKQRTEQLSDLESDINLILQMVTLFFLELDDEVPPPNLELQFIRYQFPRIIWKKQDGFNANANPFWLPKNMHCRASYLLARIISGTYAQTEPAGEEHKAVKLLTPKQNLLEESDPSNGEKQSFSFQTLLPQTSPQEIRLDLGSEETENQQLQLMPESISETFLSLQKLIQKKFSHDGVKHLLGILRQLATSSADGFCRFDTRKHLELIAKATKKGEFSSKQVNLFVGVYEMLQKMTVKRFWTQPGAERETSNPFILELCHESPSLLPCASLKKIVLDPLFLPTPENPLRLGLHLRLIQPRLFRESIYQHALLPGLASYLTGTWLNEFPVSGGVAAKSSREIIEGCAFNVTPANKTSLLNKLKSELAYMKEKCYISEYSVQPDADRNPWNDIHCITASENVLTSIAEKMRVVSAQRVSEKLIA